MLQIHIMQVLLFSTSICINVTNFAVIDLVLHTFDHMQFSP